MDRFNISQPSAQLVERNGVARPPELIVPDNRVVPNDRVIPDDGTAADNRVIPNYRAPESDPASGDRHAAKLSGQINFRRIAAERDFDGDGHCQSAGALLDQPVTHQRMRGVLKRELDLLG